MFFTQNFRGDYMSFVFLELNALSKFEQNYPTIQKKSSLPERMDRREDSSKREELAWIRRHLVQLAVVV
jgi:hypothetical protein